MMQLNATDQPRQAWVWLVVLALISHISLMGCAQRLKVVVLPFENQTQFPEDEWLRDAFSEALTDHLLYAKKPDLISRLALNQACVENRKTPYIKFTAASTAESLGKLLGADRVIYGAFQKRGSDLVTFSRMINTSNGEILHEFRLRNETPNNFLFFTQVQDTASALLPPLKISKREIAGTKAKMEKAKLRTRDFKAYELFIRGKIAFFQQSEDSFRVAANWYREAINTDFRFALAYYGLAETLAFWGYQNKTNNRPYQDFYRKSHEAIAKAKQFDPDLPYFHIEAAKKYLDADIPYVVGMTHLANKQYDLAIASFRRNLAATPQDAMTLFQMGEAYLGQNDTQRARAHYVAALEKNPAFVPAIDKLEVLMPRAK